MATRFRGEASPSASASAAIAAAGGAVASSGGPDFPMLNYSGDVIDALPPMARERLRVLREARDGNVRVVQSLSADIQDSINRKGRSLNRIRELRSDFRLSDDDPRMIDATARHDALASEMAGLQRQQQERYATNQPVAQLIEGVERFLKSLRGARSLADLEVTAPALRKNETLATAIEDRRHKLRMLAADEHTIRSASVHSTEAKKKAHTAAALLGEPSLDAILEHDGDGQITWPTVQKQLVAEVFIPDASGRPTRAAAFASIDFVDPITLSLFVNRAALHQAVDDLIDRNSDDSSALSAEDWAARLTEIAADRLRIERDEVALLEKAAAEGLVIGYRADTSPLALLQIAVS